jgi:protein-S-isoprenylcysteine O-methyltransferase Ste14
MDDNYLILVILFVVCLAIRTGYELLKEAGKIDLENKPVFGLILATMCALWALWFSLCLSDPVRVDLPEALRWGGFGLLVVGTILAVGALLQLRGVENIDHLVTSGLFAKFRHPMYIGFIFWILGWGVYHSAMLSLLIGLIGIANILYWRRLEEARLLKQFGTAYEQYRRTTWF